MTSLINDTWFNFFSYFLIQKRKYSFENVPHLPPTPIIKVLVSVVSLNILLYCSNSLSVSLGLSTFVFWWLEFKFWNSEKYRKLHFFCIFMWCKSILILSTCVSCSFLLAYVFISKNNLFWIQGSRLQDWHKWGETKQAYSIKWGARKCHKRRGKSLFLVLFFFFWSIKFF